MKASRYNVIAPSYDGTGAILFNTATAACILLDGDERAEYDAIVKGDVEDGPLVNELARQRFLVEDQLAELSYMHHVYKRSKFDTGMLELHICPALGQDPATNKVYECVREGVMSPAVQEALQAFVRDHYTRSPFQVLKVVWVLDTQLDGLDVVKGLGEAFQALIGQLGAEYRASALVAGDSDTAELAKCLDGCALESIQSTADYQHCLHAQGAASANEDFLAVATPLGDAPEPADTTLADDPVLHERALALLAQNNPEDMSREDFESFLAPLRRYCAATTEYAWAIDELGNAYTTTRDLGKADRVLFNVCEPSETRAINRKLIAAYGLETPLDTQECASCRVFPLCMGGCAQVRVEQQMLTCIPLRYAIEEYLTAYSRVL